jgi:hypothetical protein
MGRRFPILFALLSGLAFPLSAQPMRLPPPPEQAAYFYFDGCDHDWTVHFGSNPYGLLQMSGGRLVTTNGDPVPEKFTYIICGSHIAVLHTSVWPILGCAAVVLLLIVVLVTYGFAAFARPAKQNPPPNLSPLL